MKRKNQNLTDTEISAENTKNIKKGKKSRLSKKKKVVIIVLLALYAIILAATALVVFYRPQVEEKVRTYTETVTDEHGNIITVEKQEKRLDGKYNILVLGRDRWAMLTDVFMLVNIDNNTHDITVMQIPRDTWISDNNEISVPTNKINAVYATYFNKFRGEGQDEDTAYYNALLALSELLEDDLCIQIDYSAIMNLDGFVNIVDILGGVEMDVPFTMTYYDETQNLSINIPAGHQTLNGAQAEGFVRYRYGYAMADLARQDAQKTFLTALFSKVKSSVSITNVSKLTELANEIFSNLTTDMSAGDILYFAKSLLSCDMSSINMMTMPGNLANHYVVMNRAATLDVINSYFNLYDNDISNSRFDRNGAFNNAYVYSMNEAYNKPADQITFGNIYSGDVIDENGLIDSNGNQINPGQNAGQ